MQTLYLVIEKSTLSLFQKNSTHYERLYIEGNSEYVYDLNSANESINKLFKILVNEFNLNSIAEIDFIVIDNEDKVISEVVNKTLQKYIKEKYEIKKIMKHISQKLSRDKNMYILEYGINFDGKNYILSKNNIIKMDFSLLGYTITNEQLVEYID